MAEWQAFCNVIERMQGLEGKCPSCSRTLQVGDWPFSCRGTGDHSVSKRSAAVHVKERAVVWEHPLTGQVRYPGRNDAPMPDRYAQQGYVRREFESAHALSSFEKQHNVANERLNCNSGNSLEAPVQESPADTARILPVAPSGDASLTVAGQKVDLRSMNG